jgi:hypothetical protein
MNKGIEKFEARLDVRNLRNGSKTLQELRFLLLDDPYQRKLLRLTKWRRLIEVDSNSESCKNSEQSSDHFDSNKAAFLSQLAKDKNGAPEVHTA